MMKLQQQADAMRAKEEERRRQEMEANMMRQAEDKFRQLQLKEQEKIEQDQQRQVLNRAVSDSVTINDEPAPLPVLPSAPPEAEPPVDVSPSTPPNVLPPSYTSVVYVDQKPTIPSRDLKPPSTASMTCVSRLSLWCYQLTVFEYRHSKYA